MLAPVSTTITTAPASGVVSIAQAKRHLSLFDDTTFDDYIGDLILAATDLIGQHIDTYVTETEVVSNYTSFNGRMLLDHTYVSSVASVQYTDSDGVDQTLDVTEWSLDTSGAPTVLIPDLGNILLSTTIAAPVRVNYTVEVSADEVTPAMTQAALLYIKDMFEQRGNYAIDQSTSRLPVTSAILLGRQRRSYV